MTQIASGPPRQKAGRVKDKPYLGYIAALGSEQGAGCIICGAKPCQVCHFRGGEPCRECIGFGEIVSTIPSEDHMSAFAFSPKRCQDCHGTGWRYGKVDAMKNDRFTWPGCPNCHQYAKDAQHAGSEYAFWRKHGIDILGVMARLQGIYDSNPLPRALELGTEAILEVRR